MNASETGKVMGGEKKLNNAGLSLLELIVVVLIMAIMAGSAVIGLSAVYSAKAERAAGVSASVMKRARQKALSMDGDSELYVEFSLNDKTYLGKVFLDNGTIHDELAVEKIGSDQLTLTFSNHSVASSAVTVTSTRSIRIYFKKNTGGIAKVTKVESGASSTLVNTPDQLVITGSSDAKTIILGSVTGRCYTTD